MAALLPTDFASQAEYSTYYLALPDDYHPVKHKMTAFEKAEMDAALALVPRADTTKLFAVVSGNWNTAGNWHPNGVPGVGAIVLIGEGCTCAYNVHAILTELDTVRVDGNLHTDPAIDTAMLFDTMVITGTGFFRDGTREARVAPDVVHQWIIATSNGLIDVTWDTFMQSRGIISLGRVDMWGHHKTPYLEVVSPADPIPGATSLTLAYTPADWAVGDEIVIGATFLTGALFVTGITNNWRAPWPDERRTLTSVAGATLGWTGRLTYTHAGPTGSTNRQDCKAVVMNLTRNIIVRPDDPAAPIHHRGHTMQMHNPAGWNARDVEFADLGRTAKIGWAEGEIVKKGGGIAANTNFDLAASPFWNAGMSAIVFGPSFLLRFTMTGLVSAGKITIVGTNGVGGAQTEFINYNTATTGDIWSENYFLTVTSIQYDQAFAAVLPIITIHSTARQINENGVRNFTVSGSYPSTFMLDASLALTPHYTTLTNTDNLQGRYPVHFHKMGISGDILENPPILDGCSIHGSPGWLLAHHQTHMIIQNCVGYDAKGAGFVAEDGNESGIWKNCFVAHIPGNDSSLFKFPHDAYVHDFARDGVAYWFSGRAPRVTGCVAAGCQGGFVYNVRFGTTTLTRNQFSQPTSTRGFASRGIDDHPLDHFSDCVMMGGFQGFIVIKANPAQGHDVRTVIRDFKAFSCCIGVDLTYTMDYTMLNTDVFRGTWSPNSNYGESWGISFGTNSSDQSIINPICEGFTHNIYLNHHHTNGVDETPEMARFIVNPTLRGATTADYKDQQANDVILATGDLNNDPIALTVSVGGAPTFGTIRPITGTKTDEIGSIDFPAGVLEDFSWVTGADNVSGILNHLTDHGYRVDVTDAKKYIIVDEWFSSRLTGELQKIRVPIDINGYTTTSYTNHGSCDLANNTVPVIADFAVSLTRNTNLVIDVLGRATGSTVSFGGFEKPVLTDLIDNGDGTITAIPFPDSNYSETVYVWIDDIHGNTTRATMTLNVEKYKFTLGVPAQ